MTNDFRPYLIDLDEPHTKNRFPIVAQLGILSIVLVLIFGALLFDEPKEEVPLPPSTEQELSVQNETYPDIPQKIDDVELRAAAAYVWDVQAQRALYTKNPTTELPLASITKLMTTLLTYELLDHSEMTTIPLSAIRQEGSSGLMAGEQLGIEALHEMAIVSSSNDAAYAMAASVGQLLGEQDAVGQFVAAMNIRAEELGLDSLNFKNTTGLDVSTTEPGSVGNARDVSFLMEYIITEYPEIIAPTKQSATRIYNTAGAYHEVNNTNVVAMEIPNMIGSKTGYTDLAGGNLTIAFDVGLNRPIIITVLGSTRDERFTDVLKLVAAVQESVGNPVQ